MTGLVETDVLIVGLGPAGAASSLALAKAGIKNIAINKHRGTSPDPRAHITNQRTMEFLRDFGLEEAAKKIATPWKLMGEHPFSTSMAGVEYGRIPAWARSDKAQGAHIAASPTTYCDLPQVRLEPLLVSQAALAGANIRTDTEYLSHSQDELGVTAKLRDLLTGQEYEVRAKYLIGADGGRSKVAADIGLEFDGEMDLGETGSINIEFEGDLSKYCAHRPSDMYWMLQTGENLVGQPQGPGFSVLRMVEPWKRWVCVVGFDKSKGNPDLSDASVIPLVHKTIGDSSIPIKVLSTSIWSFNRKFALNNTKGRVFCMGDAVHRHTPFGGLGSNTSIQDAYNLAWKIAMVINGTAGNKLLESYEAERAPIAKQITEHAFNGAMSLGVLAQALEMPLGADSNDMEECLNKLSAPTAEGVSMRANLRKAMDGTLAGFGEAHGVELNQRYDSKAVVKNGNEQDFDQDPVSYYQPSAQAGAHLPHAWLTKEQVNVSSFDLCGKGKFTLLTGLSGQAWVKAAETVSNLLGIDLQVHVIGPGQEFVDSRGEFAAITNLDEGGALLVRPDLMIAWRAEDAQDSTVAQLTPVLKQILDR